MEQGKRHQQVRGSPRPAQTPAIHARRTPRHALSPTDSTSQFVGKSSPMTRKATGIAEVGGKMPADLNARGARRDSWAGRRGLAQGAHSRSSMAGSQLYSPGFKCQRMASGSNSGIKEQRDSNLQGGSHRHRHAKISPFALTSRPGAWKHWHRFERANSKRGPRKLLAAAPDSHYPLGHVSGRTRGDSSGVLNG